MNQLILNEYFYSFSYLNGLKSKPLMAEGLFFAKIKKDLEKKT